VTLAAGVVQVPAYLWVPPRLGSWGDEIVDWCRAMGHQIDPEQARDIDAHASYGPGGRWVALENAEIEGRQNGKTSGVVLPMTLADLWLFPTTSGDPDKVIWTAHLMKTTLDTFKTIKRLIEANPEMSRRVKAIRESKTDQGVDFMNGWTLDLMARTGGGGRGLTKCKRLVFDEALYLRVDAMGALLPTMRTHPNPQISYASSAGKPESDFLRALMKRGRAGGDPTLSYAEYKADGGWKRPGCAAGRNCSHIHPDYGGPAGCRLDDEQQWRKANHAIERGRMGVAFLRAENRALRQTPAGVLESGREMLGWEEEGDDDADRPFDKDLFAELAADQPAGERPVAFLDNSPNSRSGSIAVASVVGGRPHVDLVAYRGGVDWFVDRVKVLAKDQPDVVFAGARDGAASALEPKLTAAGIAVDWWTRQEMARACSHVAAQIEKGLITHDGDPLVQAAVEAAVKKDIGDGELWVMTRRGPETAADLSPLYAVVGALWLLEKRQGIEYDVTESVY
jgi:hypothetical protein